ncbi:MAG TPA: hypothetical protein V6D29_00135 [Leptolyngbyaceae cyanobacterium]
MEQLRNNITIEAQDVVTEVPQVYIDDARARVKQFLEDKDLNPHGSVLLRKSFVDINDGNLYDGILFSQIDYWHKGRLRVKRENHLWVAKKNSEWKEECCIGERAARESLNRLVSRGLIEKGIWKFQGIPTTHIRILHENLEKELSEVKPGRYDSVVIRKKFIDVNDGSLQDGVLLSQIYYWHDETTQGESRIQIEKNGYLWLVKKHTDWYEECRLSERTARTSLNNLVARGLIEKAIFQYKGNPTTHIRIRWDNLARILLSNLPSGSDVSCQNHLAINDNSITETSNRDLHRDYQITNATALQQAASQSGDEGWTPIWNDFFNKPPQLEIEEGESTKKSSTAVIKQSSSVQQQHFGRTASSGVASTKSEKSLYSFDKQGLLRLPAASCFNLPRPLALRRMQFFIGEKYLQLRYYRCRDGRIWIEPPEDDWMPLKLRSRTPKLEEKFFKDILPLRFMQKLASELSIEVYNRTLQDFFEDSLNWCNRCDDGGLNARVLLQDRSVVDVFRDPITFEEETLDLEANDDDLDTVPLLQDRSVVDVFRDPITFEGKTLDVEAETLE